MKIFIGCFIVLLLILVYALCNLLNPDSMLCSYRIYKQTNTYEVWWVGRTKDLEGSFKTYKEAKEFQINKCKSLEEFITNSPKGEHIK